MSQEPEGALPASRWELIKEVAAEALEREPDERAEFLRGACRGDAALQQEVESLLGADPDRDGVLDRVSDAVPPSLRPGDVLASRFEIARLIGRGGMGEVYLAQDRQLGEAVAIKTVQPLIALDDAAIERFKREVQLAKQVTHPHVCRIHDFGYQPPEAGRSHRRGIAFVTMELLEGETLADRIRQGRLHTTAALPIVAQMVSALAAMHAKGIVHRDLKPGNVMLTADGAGGVRTVVMDFGVAHRVQDALHVAGSPPEKEDVLGTPEYLAPEQLSGGKLTAATDIYALGVVMYEMVTGQSPFQGDTPFDVAIKRLEPPATPSQLVPALDPRWERAILRCLRHHPNERFQTANEVLGALGLRQEPVSTRCRVCQREHSGQARFCDGCGAALRRFWIVGSARDCHVVVSQRTVSRHHCRVTESGDDFQVDDLASQNGTWVNGRRIGQTTLVARGDAITLGTDTSLPWAEIDPGTRVLRVGRDPDNDVVLDHTRVSGHHARVVVRDGAMTIDDLGSINGTSVGHVSNRITTSAFSAADVLLFGGVPVPAADLIAGRVKLEQAAAPAAATDAVVVGRDPQCDRFLDHPMISWHHARLSRSAGGYTIEDLGSTNGTFVNGKRITQRVPLGVGDSIGLGNYTFTFSGGSTFQHRDRQVGAVIEARGVAADAGGRRLIEGISLAIMPGELVALMGVAGAGKTTLLEVLNGYAPPSQGSVHINGHNLYTDYRRVQGCLGYAPQADIMHGELTVSQALFFNAKLRLPSDYSDQEIHQRVERVIQQLGLGGTEHVVIGSASRKGISGGQRKRVNLAMELLTDPDVLFLDEPTSGLSSEDAFSVIKILRQLADAGKTILLTIHQPGLDVFRMMDTVAMLAKDTGSTAPAKLVYFGPAYPDAVQFFNPGGLTGMGPDVSPDEMSRGLAREPAERWLARFSASRYRRQYVDERLTERPAGPMQATASRGGPTPMGLQWRTLVRRAASIKLHDRMFTGLLLALSALVGGLLVVVCGRDDPATKPNAVLGMVVAALFLGSVNAYREIVDERAVYRRERMAGLHLRAYIGSKVMVLGVLSLIQCAILLIIVREGTKLEGSDFMSSLIVLTMVSLAAVGYGLVISAASRTTERATQLLFPLLIAAVLFSGGFSILPEYARPIAWLLPSRWGFEAMTQLHDLSNPQGGLVRDRFFPSWDQFDTAVILLILAVMLLALLRGVGLILKKQDVHP